MAQLAKDPTGWELEDSIAAHFVARGCYVETGVKERNPDELLELDIVWTDYRKDPQRGRPVEVKSGDWGVGDVFKFFGWTRYLGLEPGEFVYKEPCGRLDPASLTHLQARTGMALHHLPKPEDAETYLKTVGLPDPAWSELPETGDTPSGLSGDCCDHSAKQSTRVSALRARKPRRSITISSTTLSSSSQMCATG